MDDLLPFIGIPIFIVVFMVIFFVVIPNLGDWKKLARHYGTNQRANTVMGERIHFGRINIGGLNLKNMVRGYKTHQGLFLTQFLNFTGTSPNILIPWDEFQAVEERKILFFKTYRLPIGDPQVSYLEMSEKHYSVLADRLPA